MNRYGETVSGLFGYCEATLRNVGVVNCDITAKPAKNDAHAIAAALAGEIKNTTISNCYSTGNVTGSRTIGGLVGYVSPNCTITDCYNACTVTGNGYTRAYTGGLVGYINDGITVKNSYNKGAVSAKLSNPSHEDAFCATGGITSYIQDGEKDGPSQVINCWNTADISITTNADGNTLGNYTVGGIAGSASGKLENCYNAGHLKADVAYLGGITGRLYAEASDCHNNGAVENTSVWGYHNAGGIAGICGTGSVISNCYNTGKVSSSSRSGGIVAYAFQDIYRSHNVGEVSTTESLRS